MPKLQPLIDADRIALRTRELAEEIRRDHAQDHPLLLIGVLKGSFLFMADLARELADLDIRVDFLGVRSYAGTSSTGVVEITHDLRHAIEGQHCLIVEDIVDTGLTLKYLSEALTLRRPASLDVVALLDKPSRRKVDFHASYVGFTIPDAFVVGYGLDLDERYRNLPYVAIYQPD